MAYTVLARRYRSQRFDDVVGQEAIAQTLKNAIKTGRVAHAYLFSGTRGVGKTTMARILAKSLNCLASESATIEPCLECDSCIAVNAGEDIDVIEIDGASNRGIENIRELRQNAIYRPARARFKIYIIDEVHMLTTEAFNALLKILEEPPGHVKFIFATTEPNKVLATIQSRCQRFDFGNISNSDIISQLKNILNLEKVKFEDDLIIALARLANGSMRDALSLLDQLISTGDEVLKLEMLETFLGQPGKDKVYDLVEKIADSDGPGSLTAIESLLNSGFTAVQVIDALVETIRDIMVIKACDSESPLVVLTDSERKRLMPLSENFDAAGLIYNIALLEKLRWPIKNSDNPRALLEASVLRLTLSEHFMNLPELLSKLNSPGPVTRQPLKKNVIPNTPAAGPKPQTPQAADNPPSKPILSENADLAELKAKWDKILNLAKTTLNPRIAGMLQKAVPTTLAANSLSLSFKSDDEFAKNLCQSGPRADIIRKLLSDALGRKITVKFEVDSKSKPAGKVRPPGARMSKKVIDDLANSPAVKTVLLGLNANIVDVIHEKK